MSFHLDHGVDPPVAPPGEPVHWLVRPATVRGLWIGLGAVLAALVLGDFLLRPHAGFEIDGIFGFHAWYGLGICVATVLFAKGLGAVLRRPDTWYDERSGSAGERSEAAPEVDREGAGTEAPQREGGSAAATTVPAADGAREEGRPDD